MGAGRRNEDMPSLAFMSALDRLTTAVYPHKTATPPKHAEAPPKFNTMSLACLGPVLVAMVKLTFHVFLPYVMIGSFAAAALGAWNDEASSPETKRECFQRLQRDVCVAVGVCVMAYLCVWEPTFGAAFLRHHQVLPPGLHCRRSRRSEAIISMVPALRYPHYKSTPWILGGDVATIFPFLAFRLPRIEYVRRWVVVSTKHTRGAGAPDYNPTSKQTNPVSNGASTSSRENEVVHENGKTPVNGVKALAYDESCGDTASTSSRESMFDRLEEAVALDLALPEAGMDSTKPFYLVLHGLNGGSAEGYVLDFAAQALKRGCGVCVMIGRGCMGTPVRGSELFHGARTSDVADVVRTLRQALPPETPLCLVGYSMGAIIATNYAAISGKNSGLDCCVSMSGSFDTRTNMTSQHSLRLWQPILAHSLKENFVSQHTRKAVRRGVDLSRVERCRDVVDFDTHMVAPYNGYANVTDYYVDMSAAAGNKIRGLETPLLAVSALDDPIMTAKGCPINDARNNKHLYILLTRNGGHVGWPVGWLPTKSKWRWMSSTSLDFCEAVVATASIPSD